MKAGAESKGLGGAKAPPKEKGDEAEVLAENKLVEAKPEVGLAASLRAGSGEAEKEKPDSAPSNLKVDAGGGVSKKDEV